MDKMVKKESQEGPSFKNYFVPLTPVKAAWWILIIGFFVYAKSLSNGFVWDDYYFIINNPQVHILNLPYLFGNNLFNSGPFYRPLPAVYFAFVYSLFHNTAFFYHFTQLILHLLSTFLLFIFFGAFFSEGIAFFLALLFLVHPINVESVAYIAATQSQLYFISGISALLLAQKKNLTTGRFCTILFFLFICIFTKEVGFLFLFLTILYRALFKLGDVKRFLFFSGLMTLFYLCIRVFYGGVIYAMNTSIPIAGLSLTQRLFTIPAIVVYYIKTFLFPSHLVIWQIWVVKTMRWDNFYLPLLLCVLFFGCTSLAGYLLFQKSRKNFKFYLFFFLWFLFGIGMIAQIVPLEMTVADRWFYFPIVGLLGMIGVGCAVWLPLYKTYKKQYLLAAVILLLLFGARTFARTLDYKNNITLYGHDIRAGDDNMILLNLYGMELFKAKKIDEACIVIKQSVARAPDASNTNELGDCYRAKKQYNDAIIAYRRSFQLVQGKPTEVAPLTVYRNLAHAYILAGRMQEAADFINNQAIQRFPEKGKEFLDILNVAESEKNYHMWMLHNPASTPR